MNNFSLTDETLNINSTASYLLSMQAGADGFYYCILDPGRNKYIAAKYVSFSFEDVYSDEFHERIVKIIDSDEFLNCRYKSVKFIYNGHKSTIVPSPLFDRENLKSFYNFNHESHDLETLHFNKLKNIDAFNIFSLPYNLVDTVYMRFANAKLYHQATPFIENSLMKYKPKGNKYRVLVNTNHMSFDIVVVNSSSLQLYNNFAYKTPDEYAYFIMYIFEQLKLNPEETELILSGDINKNSDLFKKIKLFVKYTQFEKMSDSYTYSYIFNEVPSGFFVNLINLNRCE